MASRLLFKAFLGGFLGLDRFYLGELSAGTLKLSTLGGFGVWWLWDIIWIGSAPILTRRRALKRRLGGRFHGRGV